MSDLLFCSLYIRLYIHIFFFFFFNDTATTEIYTLSLHDALPISYDFDEIPLCHQLMLDNKHPYGNMAVMVNARQPDRKSTRLNSSHGYISYAVFCLKKKKTPKT